MDTTSHSTAAETPTAFTEADHPPRFCICSHADGPVAIATRSLPIYARGAAMLATLAAPPTRQDDNQTLTTYLAYCRIALADYQVAVPEDFTDALLLPATHLTMSLAQAGGVVERAARLIDHRLGAAHVMVPTLRGLAAGSAKQRRDNKPLVAYAQDVIARDEDVGLGRRRFEQDPKNFLKRILRPSLPVLPLALALQDILHESTARIRSLAKADQQALRYPQLRGAPQYDWSDILYRADLQDEWEGRAMRYEPLVRKLKVPRIRSVVRFRLI